MECKYCGKKDIREGARFCTACGKPLMAPPTATPPAAPPPRVVPPAGVPGGVPGGGQMPNNAASYKPPRPKAGIRSGRSNWDDYKGPTPWLKWVILAVVIVVMISIGVVVWSFASLHDFNMKEITAIFAPKSTSEPASSAAQSVAVPEAQSSAESVAPTAEPTEQPGQEGLLTQDVPAAQPSDSQVVLRNARANAVLTANGSDVPFTYVGQDLVVRRSDMPDVAQLHIIAPISGGSWQTATVWYNFRYGNELSFGADYGEYQECGSDGHDKPSFKTLDVLTWAYYTSFLQAINDQSINDLAYSTAENTRLESEHVFSKENAKNTYSLDDYSAQCDEGSITYQSDGSVLYNAAFRCKSTHRTTGKETEIRNYRTIKAVWEDGMWKVARIVFLSEDDYNSRHYADFK